MKKLLVLLMVACLLATSVFATGSKEAPAAEVKAPVIEELTHDELVARAKEEGKVVVYATSSRIAKAAVAFTEKYEIGRASCRERV